ncbi:MAG: PD40 domain-containing protein [Phycisphaerales bacterium]|nr:PD40 domain-containing protein [Phycisphaerales bacterium]
MTTSMRPLGRRLGALSAAMLGAAFSATALGEASITPDATMIQYPDVSATSIVFVYANDLWIVPRAGGTATKIASPAGKEMFPRFSPDGKSIAFIGNYDGGKDIYTLALDGAGIAQRLTYHPAMEFVSDWTKDNQIVFFANGLAGLARQQQLFKVDANGGLPEQLPVPYGANGTISADGEWLAYSPHQRDFRTWKRYQGGMATDIWLFNLRDNSSRKITDWKGTDTIPMWQGNTVYYLSDAGPNHKLNIWSFDTQTDRRTQVTNFEDFDCKWPSIGPGANGNGEIVFQNGPDMYLLDLATMTSRKVEIEIPGDRPSLRPNQIDYSQYVGAGTISPTAKRLAVEARGDIWSLPAEDGITRNLTRTAGVAERDPSWSPDGKWIAYLSDETGEYEVYIKQSDGKGETRQLTSDGTGYRHIVNWSPDSKSICFTEKTGEIKLLDVEGATTKHVATDPWAVNPLGQEVSWSHDSKWLAFSIADEANGMGVVHLYSIETGELTPVTSPMFATTSPAFDRKGEFLYMTSSRTFSPTYSDIDTTFVYRDSGVLLAVPLNSEVENPWKLKNEEEEWDDEADGDSGAEAGSEDAADDGAGADENADAPSSPIHGVWEGVVRGLKAMGLPDDEMAIKITIIAREDGTFYSETEFMGETDDSDVVTFDEATGELTLSSSENGMTSIVKGTLDGDKITGTWQIVEMGMGGTWEATRSDEKVDDSKAEDKSDEPVKIDLDGFERRAMLLPVEAGNFGMLRVNDKNQLLYMRGGEGMPSVKLYDITDKDGGEKNVVSGVGQYEVSADGKKIGVAGPTGFAIVSAAPGQSIAKPIDTSMMKGTIEPREEWMQIFTDAWRIQRDFFYDRNMHGVDWEGVRYRYSKMLEDCVTREDVSFVIGEMISELNVGHAYYWGGDTEDEPWGNGVGMLGCDYELGSTPEGSAYRISKIYEGGAWDADARGPLSQPGVDVKEGDFLLAVNGVPVDTSKSPWAAFMGTAGKTTMLTVSDKPVMDDDAREVLVKPIGDEGNLRYRAWIERNRAYVDYKTNGRVGYIYVPNTGVDGQNDLFRQFYGQAAKDGLIIDERWNGGGQIPTRFIELMNRPLVNFWARRDGKDWPWPPDSSQSKKVMLINGLAGSGGDMFPALFRQNGLGKLIGMRTWGGLVGISGNPGLIDGGYTAVPTFGYYELDGTWGIEGHGVDPDIEVIDDPALMVDGGDPQLDAAIRQVMGEVERGAFEPPKRPAGPDRSGMGVPESDW